MEDNSRAKAAALRNAAASLHVNPQLVALMLDTPVDMEAMQTALRVDNPSKGPQSDSTYDGVSASHSMLEGSNLYTELGSQ
jgi:hypothetical protein